MAVAVRMFDPRRGRTPQWTRDARGYTGTEHYDVDSSEPETALAAAGLPALYQSHPTMPSTVCVGHVYEYVCGDDASGNGRSIVTAQFRPPGSASVDLVAQEHEAYTEFRASPGQIEVRLDASGTPLIEPASKETFAAELVVSHYVSTLGLVALFLPLIGKGNSNSVTIPRVYGAPASAITFAPRQLLARSFDVSPVRDGMLRLSLTFGVGQQEWYFVRQTRLDAAGQPTGPIEAYDVQGEIAYPGSLFPAGGA